MKRIITLIISLAIITSIVPCSLPACATEEKLVDYLPKTYIDSPLPSAQALHALYAEIDGKDYMFTSSSGKPAVLNVYNLDDNYLVATHKLPGASNVWYHTMNVDGNLYIISKGYMFRYNPRTNELKEYGYIASENLGDTFTFDHDEEGNIYIACCGNGEIIKYDIKSDTCINLGKVDEEYDEYIRSLSYCNGNIYLGIKDGSYVGFWRMNTEDITDKEEIPLPENPAYYDLNKMSWVYSSMTVRDKIIVYAKEYAVSPMLVYDTTGKKWMDIGFTGSFKGHYVSPEKNGKCYFTSKGYMYALNTETWKVENLDWRVEPNDNTIATGWVTMENNPEHSGDIFVTLASQGSQPIYYDITKKERFTLPQIELIGSAFTIQSISRGDFKNGDDALYIGSYLGETSARYDFKSKKKDFYSIHQTEGMLPLNGKMYFGTYTKANFHEYDYTKPVAQRLQHKGQIKPNQDRPFALAGAEDGRVWIGTIPDYGRLDGALSVYDPKTEEMKTYVDIIKNQSIISLACRDGLVYGTTSIWGGLSGKPSEPAAKMFIFDPKTEKVIKEFTPKIPDIENPSWLGGIAFDKNGKLWIATGGTLFSVNPDTQEVIDSIKFIDYTYSTTTHTWRPLYIRFDEEGRLYVNINSIQVVDVDTLKTQSLLPQIGYKVHVYDIDRHGNIFFAEGSDLWAVPRNTSGYNVSQDAKMIKKEFSDKTALFMEDCLIYSNGKIKQIDPDNENIAPLEENGRTLVPVRVLSEEFGAKVLWDEQNELVTVEYKDKTINIKIGASKISVNGTDKKIDCAAKIIEGRTFIPLRAVAEAFGKSVYWNDIGLIVISDKEVNYDKTMIDKINMYSDFYMHPRYKEEISKADDIALYERKVAAFNGEQIKFKNWNFEDKTEGDRVPGYIKTTDFTNGATAYVSDERAFVGEQSLNINDTSTTATAGYASSLIPYSHKDDYAVVIPLYISSGRTSIEIAFYDVDGVYLGRDVHNETPEVGMWNIMSYKVPKLFKSAKYIRIRCYTTEYWMSDSYYDEITVIKYNEKE